MRRLRPYRPRLRRPLRRAAASLLALSPVVAAMLVLQPAGSAFTADTSNPTSTLTAGTVNIADNDGGVAPFTVSGAQPNDSGSKCIRVTYSGSLDAAVELYASASGGSLAPYLKLTVDAGTGTLANCSDFASSETLATDQSVTAFAAAASSWATGLGTWAPAGGSGATRTYRIAWSLPATTPPSAQGTSANLTLAWEARSG